MCDFCTGETYLTTAYVKLRMNKEQLTNKECLKVTFTKCPEFANCSARGLNPISYFIINFCPICGERINQEAAENG